MRRWLARHRGWSAVVAFAVLFGVAFFVYRTLFTAGDSQAVQYVTQPAEKGTLVVSVSGTGNVELGQAYDVVPSVSGVVTGLSVQVGDRVTKGQVLFTLKNDQLDANVTSAQAAYDQARASLYNAQANERQAEQSLEQLRDAARAQNGSSSTNPTTPPTTRPSVTVPSTTVPPTTTPPTTTPPTTTPPTTTPPTTTPPTTTPPTQSDPPPSQSPPTSNPPPAQSPPTSKSPTSSSAGSLAAPGEKTLAAAPGPGGTDTSDDSAAAAPQTPTTVTAEDIEIAERKLAAAQASLAAARANLDNAKFNLQQAKDEAAKRTVTAPADGVVTILNVQEGVTLGSSGTSGTTRAQTTGQAADTAGQASGVAAQSSGAALTIVNPRSISAVIQLNEVDVPQIEVGQKATLTFDALPDLTLAGRVTVVGLSGTVNQGVVTYNVTIVPDSPDDRVRAGMTTSASIVTAVRPDVLLVPASAVKTAGGGGSYVQVLVNGQPQQRSVEVGLANDTSAEITAGLQPGEAVIVQTINPNTTASTAQSGGFGMPGGGGMRIPGAGGFGGAGR